MTLAHMQLFPFLRSVYGELTKTEKRIADYMMNNAMQVMDQTITDIAKHTQSSEITVSRFCKKVGCHGLQEVKRQLTTGLSVALTEGYHDIQGEDSSYTVMLKIFRNITEGLQDTASLLDYAQIEKAVELLQKADRVVVYGFGNSATVCQDIATRFLRLGLVVQAYSDSHMQVTSATLLHADDVVIAVSHTGRSKELIHSVQVARKRGARIIVITSHGQSYLAKLGDICLCGMGREVQFTSEASSSRLIHMAIGDILYARLTMLRLSSFNENMENMRREIHKQKLPL
ncbi:MurR/RpiR family transcriptional regulator [Megasphaera hutchinsoni]|nr:MurR/RpiR family transcriptional regulator [Megasphaera hutchinsoni]